MHRLRAAIAAIASALDGLDAVTFTGGVGENATRPRPEVLSKMRYLRLSVDDEANSAATTDTEITVPALASGSS